MSGPNINRPVFDELREHPGFNARRDGVVRFLAFSTQYGPDVVVQPDSGKVGAFERRARGGGLRLWFNPSDAVDYYEGEAPPSRSA